MIPLASVQTLAMTQPYILNCHSRVLIKGRAEQKRSIKGGSNGQSNLPTSNPLQIVADALVRPSLAPSVNHLGRAAQEVLVAVHSTDVALVDKPVTGRYFLSAAVGALQINLDEFVGEPSRGSR